MEIRKAEVADAERIAELLDQLGYSDTGQFMVEKIVQLTADPDEELAVAVDDGTIVAVVSLHFIPQLGLPGAFARISYLCVDEQARGRGFGKELVLFCEFIAKGRGCDRMELHCHERREDAHRFYRGRGYSESRKYLIKKLG